MEDKSAIHLADPKTAVARHCGDGSHAVSDVLVYGVDMITPNHHGGNLDEILLRCECRYNFYTSKCSTRWSQSRTTCYH